VNILSDDSKAINCYIFSIAGEVLSWKSKKLTILAHTTMKEVSWFRCLLATIPLWKKPLPAVLIHCDSTVTIMIRDDKYVANTKLLESYFLLELRVDHLRTDENLVDLLMKGLTREKIHNTLIKMRLLYMEKRITYGGKNITLDRTSPFDKTRIQTCQSLNRI
jgi:hypothetical protein